MKHLILILLLLPPCFAWAQTDTLWIKQDTLPDPATLKIDSLEQSFTKKSDSLKQSYTRQKETLRSLKLRYLGKIDSLKGIQPTSFPTTRLDSLKKPEPNFNEYTKKIDSLDHRVADLEKQTTRGIDSLKNKVNQQLNKLKLPKEADAQIGKLTAAMDKVSVPSFDSDVTGKLGLDKVNIDLPAIPGAENLPSADLPNTNLPQVNANIPSADLEVPELKNNLPSTDINTGKLGEVTGQAGDIQKQLKEATGSREALGNTLESKADEQIKGLPDQKLPDATALPGDIPKSGDEAKQQLMDLARNEAINHFAGKEAVLTTAMEKMSKYKQKYSSVSSLSDIKDVKRYNELKGKPLIERLVPALTLQFQSWEDLMLDINPSVGYKFTTHITAGLGWNQRVAYNLLDNAFNPAARIFGIRSYGEYNFTKGFGFRIDIESMNTALPKSIATDVVTPREWVWSAMAGIKQRYPIFHQLKGNAQIMYNLFDKDYRSPYVGRFNARLGFEFTMKKKTKESTKKKEDS